MEIPTFFPTFFRALPDGVEKNRGFGGGEEEEAGEGDAFKLGVNPRGPKCYFKSILLVSCLGHVVRDLVKICVFGAIFETFLVVLAGSLRMKFRNSDIFLHFFFELYQME